MIEQRYAMTLPGIEVNTWQIRNGFDRAARALADRHYSRRASKIGSNQIGGAGRRLVLVTPCERALWVTRWPYRHLANDGLDAWRCSYFRNEGAGRASDLIRAAMELTSDQWGEIPVDGWVTWIDPRKVASPNPGYCFKQAGWWLDREWSHRYLIRLRASDRGNQ
jgi:hypothetical protein